jgi:hypothetical protein
VPTRRLDLVDYCIDPESSGVEGCFGQNGDCNWNSVPPTRETQGLRVSLEPWSRLGTLGLWASRRSSGHRRQVLASSLPDVRRDDSRPGRNLSLRADIFDMANIK